MEIFVGGLPLSLRKWHLQEIFEKYGKVSSATVVIDYDTKQSKGYGFVKMPDRLQGVDAIASLNGREIDGVPLVVNETKFQRSEGRDENPRATKPALPPKKVAPSDRYGKPASRKTDAARRPGSNSGKKNSPRKK